MRPLTYSRAADVDDALALAAANPASAFLAGGTNEVDLIRAGISHSAAPRGHQRAAADAGSRTAPTADCTSARSRG